MDEVFRRAIRKMTGASLVRLSSRPDRNTALASLSEMMETTWSIALFEHLDAAIADPASTMSGPEMISFGPVAWNACEKDFPLILDECTKRFDEFRSKWMQRFSTDEVHRILLESGYLVQSEGGWNLNMKGTNTEVRQLYNLTIHLMAGDAEKMFVMLVSRALHLQERLSKAWYKESALDPISKVLPTLEASLRDREGALIANLRGSIADMAFKRFSAAFKTRGKPRRYATSRACARSVGALWNPSGAYENSFLAFTEDFCDYTGGLALFLCEWYRDKWSLYLRGFSRGQLDLFGKGGTLQTNKMV